MERTGNGGGASKGGAPAFTAKCGQRLVLPRVKARDQLHDLVLESPNSSTVSEMETVTHSRLS